MTECLVESVRLGAACSFSHDRHFYEIGHFVGLRHIPAVRPGRWTIAVRFGKATLALTALRELNRQ